MAIAIQVWILFLIIGKTNITISKLNESTMQKAHIAKYNMLFLFAERAKHMGEVND